MRDRLIGPVEQVAPLLLGSTLLSRLGGVPVAVRVVEVEAYGGSDDPASHAYRGRTARNASMFATPGTAYVYFTYGMHWCLNVAVQPEGTGAAVLLRAGAVTRGADVARVRRRQRSGAAPADRDLARGPARLCTTLAVTGETDGADLLDESGLLTIMAAPPPLVANVRTGPRVGIREATDRPWRFWLCDEPAVSAYRDGGRRPARRRET